MKKIRTLFLSLLLLVCCLLPAGKAEAASARRLFTLVINDGFVSQNVPVYQYSDGTVAAKKSLRTLSVYAGAKQAAVSIKEKTAYYKNMAKSIVYKKSAALSAATKLSFTVKQKDGSRKTFQIKLIRPAMPKITALTASPSVSAGWLPSASSKLSVKLKFGSSVAVKAYYKVKDSSGKLVYSKVLGTRKSGTYTNSWDGKPSSGNEAGLSSTEYVPAGAYKLTGYLRYTVGGKNKYIKKTTEVTVKKNTDSGIGTTPGDTENTDKAWSWKVYLAGNDTLDYLAEVICRQVLTDGMTELERARAIYNWCASNLKYDRGDVSMNGTGKAYMDIKSAKAKAAIKAYGKQIDAMVSSGKASVNSRDNYFGTSAGMVAIRTDWAGGGLVLRKGDCLIMSIVYITLCRHAGLTVDLVENDSSAGHHFWNVIQIGGKYYMADVNQASSSFLLRGTKFFYSYPLYSTVLKTSQYAIAKKVSASDCPGR
ncbi:MAG: FlgD immunoglobulin-like domain containing protein [Lachnospiraceae bacterium]|nr:FlgD immunoglobulin-like domain containing protein [Lachnospiraceae bacterium]